MPATIRESSAASFLRPTCATSPAIAPMTSALI